MNEMADETDRLVTRVEELEEELRSVNRAMTLERAREIYGDARFNCFLVRHEKDDEDIVVEGHLTADQLEAVAVLMRAGEL